MNDFFIYLLILAGSTYLIRAVPFVAIKRKTKNKFINSFLFYVPYAVLASMTIPHAFYATGSLLSATVGLLTAATLAFKGKGLTAVSLAGCGGALFVSILTSLIL